MARDADYNKLIHSKRWLYLRRDILNRHPLCKVCESRDRITPASEIHHRIPVETGNTFAEKASLCFDVTNLVPICRNCHLEEHRRLKSSSKEEHKRRQEEHTNWFKRTFMDDGTGDGDGPDTPGGCF